jgi:hypothetical protein
MDDLAATLTNEEQLGFERLTAFAADTAQPRNLATFVADTTQLGGLSICASGSTCGGEKMFSTTAYINGTLTKFDIYRLKKGE